MRYVAMNDLHEPVADMSAVRNAYGHDVLAMFRACQDCLTVRQWEALVLLYGRHMTQQAVAMTLGIAPSSVSGLLKRARQVLDSYRRQVRREAVEVRRVLARDPLDSES